MEQKNSIGKTNLSQIISPGIANIRCAFVLKFFSRTFVIKIHDNKINTERMLQMRNKCRNKICNVHTDIYGKVCYKAIETFIVLVIISEIGRAHV